MSTPLWILLYITYSLMCKWIISWGGAELIKGWKSIFFTETESTYWNAEQIRAVMLLFWIVATIMFVIGLFYPQYRFYNFESRAR